MVARKTGGSGTRPYKGLGAENGGLARRVG